MMHTQNEDMLPEYDFSAGVRGKYYRAMQQGYTVTVHQADGSTVTKKVEATPDAVLLDQDVKAYFPDAYAVNAALRTLIHLVHKPHQSV